MDTNATLGFVGLGVMGAPMCANLVRKSNHPVQVFDVAPAGLQAAVSAGAAAEPSVAAVGAAAEIVFLSLPSITEVETVVAQLLGGDRKPRMIVDMSTSDVARTRALATKVNEQGVAYVDAPVARTAEAAVKGTLMISVGGTPEDVARVRPLLECMGSDVLHCGGVGSGQMLKILNNMMVFMTVTALAEVLTIGRRAGMDGELLFKMMSEGSADSFVLRNHGIKSMVPDRFPEKTFPTVYAIKDAGLGLALAEQVGFEPHAARYAYDLLCCSRDAGLDQNYHPALIQVVDGRRGQRPPVARSD